MAYNGLFNWLSNEFADYVKNDEVNQTVQNLDSITQGIYANAQQIWEREDTAYQRMVKDMKAAGLNPWTGVSSGGSPTSTTNPSMESLTGLLNVLNTSIANKNMYITAAGKASNSMYQVGNLFTKVISALGNLIGNL